jgi:hypothetical protein
MSTVTNGLQGPKNDSLRAKIIRVEGDSNADISK